MTYQNTTCLPIKEIPTYIYVCAHVRVCTRARNWLRRGWEEVIPLYVLLNWVEIEMTLKYKYSLPRNPKLLVGINIWNTKFNYKSKLNNNNNNFHSSIIIALQEKSKTKPMPYATSTLLAFISNKTQTFWEIYTRPCMF